MEVFIPDQNIVDQITKDFLKYEKFQKRLKARLTKYYGKVPYITDLYDSYKSENKETFLQESNLEGIICDNCDKEFYFYQPPDKDDEEVFSSDGYCGKCGRGCMSCGHKRIFEIKPWKILLPMKYRHIKKYRKSHKKANKKTKKI